MKRTFDAVEFESPLSPAFKFTLFKSVYKDYDHQIYDLKEDDVFFKKNSTDLLESYDYILYVEALQNVEIEYREKIIRIQIRQEENRELERRRQERIDQDSKLNMDHLAFRNSLLHQIQSQFTALHREKLEDLNIEFKGVFDILQYSLISFMNPDGGQISDEEKLELQNFCFKTFGRFSPASKFILKLFKIEFFDSRPRIPLDSSEIPIPPCSLNGEKHIEAQNDQNNFIYGYPIEIIMEFPIYCCHPVFCEFENIIKENKSSEAYRRYTEFFKTETDLVDFDDCMKILISIMLIGKRDGFNENVFVKEFVEALQIAFSKESVASQIPMSISALDNNKFKLDAGIFIGKFPFVLVEAKNSAYSLEAVLKGLQYYGLVRLEVIDNNPCFLLTIDHGILFVYGVAIVSQRIVCDCLTSFEFTNYHFNVAGFLTRLYRCLSAFYYFHKSFSHRIEKKTNANDPQHQKYNQLKLLQSPDLKPIPAIFDIKAWKSNDNDSSNGDSGIDRIPITFKEVKFLNNFTQSITIRSNLSKNVFLVRTEREENAILKVCYNYDIQVHEILAKENLAPKIIGYEKLCESCQVILMEFLDPAQNYMSVYDFCSKKNSDTQLKIIGLLEELLKKIRAKGIVHGDFRCTNVFMKLTSDAVVEIDNVRSVIDDDDDDDDIKEMNSNDCVISDSTVEFKIIDFEFSGMEKELYPCVALKNKDIPWHPGFKSFKPRQFSHDDHMLKKMIYDFNRKEAKYNAIFN